MKGGLQSGSVRNREGREGWEGGRGRTCGTTGDEENLVRLADRVAFLAGAIVHRTVLQSKGMTRSACVCTR